MEFGILGPLLVRDESGPLAVRAAKQRTLMAALLLGGGRVVPVDRLVDTLWDGAPPASAVAGLRNYVLRLRGCLGGAGRRIGFRDRGYVLEVAEEEVDLLRFARLRDEGAAAFAQGQFALAGKLLGRALAQWRGPALVDVESDALHREECPHLAESRLDAVELRHEAELRAVGRVPWTAELRDLARAHPERERLWEYLISSLHTNGRRTEAVAEYRRMEQTLAQDYGVRPGERLRALHGRICPGEAAVRGGGQRGGGAAERDSVRVSAAVAASAAAALLPTAHSVPASRSVTQSAVPSGPVPVSRSVSISASMPASIPGSALAPAPVPMQIPAAPADLTGRADETAQLVARLTGTAAAGGAPTVVSGQPGIGKTALALHAAHVVRDAFPGGLLYADLRASTGKPARPADVLAFFLKACGVPVRALPSGLDDRAALLRSLLAHRRALLVLDDAEDAGQLRALLPGPGSGAALITSRTRLDELGGVVHVEPGPLPDEAAARLLAAIAGRARTAAEPRPVAELVRLCEGLPLALRLAGARLASRPGRSVRWLVDRLTATPSALFDELRVGRLELCTGLAGVCRRLDQEQARAFRLLAAGGSGASGEPHRLDGGPGGSDGPGGPAGPGGPGLRVPEAARLTGLPQWRAEELLELLVDRYLLASGRLGHYEFRPLTRAYGRSLAARTPASVHATAVD